MVAIMLLWRSHCGAVETNPTRNQEVAGLIPGLVQWVKDPALLWLWCRPAAVAPSRPLAWEPPYSAGASLEKPGSLPRIGSSQKEKYICLVNI